MIHYTCDCCKRIIDSEEELRYVVRMEVYAVMDDTSDDDDDRDHLSEIHEILEKMEDAASDQIGDEVYQQVRYDLCPECRKRFVENPFVRDTAKQYFFSQN
jgi:hypothetical protein